jgi:UTP-glucose-1-phosphate uridylyltransferase
VTGVQTCALPICVQASRGKVLGYRFRGKRFDCGSLRGFRDATNYFFDLLPENQAARGYESGA